MDKVVGELLFLEKECSLYNPKYAQEELAL